MENEEEGDLLVPTEEEMYELTEYEAPGWMTTSISPEIIPKTKVKLASLPTAIHRFSVPAFTELGVDLWIKRDDLTSNDLSGNKVRKLEFLLARALEAGHDSIITIGGEQSNHCRATAAAARQLGMEPYLILRTNTAAADLTLTGNLLINRMVGSQIRTVSPKNYFTIGGNQLIAQLAEELKILGKNPFCIPVGGSNVLGTFGYLNAAQEILSSYCRCNSPTQCSCECPYQHIVFASGSGGTAAGLAIGMRLAGVTAQLHTCGVCDSPEEFYQIISDLAEGLGLDTSSSGPLGNAHDWIQIHQGKGNGYAISTPEELEFLYQVSSSSGVILDPVYSGKGLFYFCEYLRASPERFRKGDKVLFVHTGGLYGLYANEGQLLPLLPTDFVQSLRVEQP